MSRTTDHRLQRLATAIESTPLPPGVIQEAFQRFREHSELPETRRLAAAVVRQVKTDVVMTDELGHELDLLTQLHALQNQAKRPCDPVMASLYDEAVVGTEPVRCAARDVLTGDEVA